MKLVAVLLVLSVILLADHGAEAQNCRNCQNNWNPVCGSTNRRGQNINCTFRNQCIMERYACLRRERWSALLGVCDVPTNPRECPRL